MPRWWVLHLLGARSSSPCSTAFNVGPASARQGPASPTTTTTMAACARGASAERRRRPTPPTQLLAHGEGSGRRWRAGKGSTTTNCVACHGADGGGLIGPNLTDDYWIHGGSRSTIYATVADGVLDKGMPAWGKMLKPEEVDRGGGLRHRRCTAPRRPTRRRRRAAARREAVDPVTRSTIAARP